MKLATFGRKSPFWKKRLRELAERMFCVKINNNFLSENSPDRVALYKIFWAGEKSWNPPSTWLPSTRCALAWTKATRPHPTRWKSDRPRARASRQTTTSLSAIWFVRLSGSAPTRRGPWSSSVSQRTRGKPSPASLGLVRARTFLWLRPEMMHNFTGLWNSMISRSFVTTTDLTKSA